MRRLKLTHGTVVAYIALFIALGGVSYAATQLPEDSVGTAQLQDGGVMKPDIRKNAVGQGELRANSVGTYEVKDSSLLCQDFDPALGLCGPHSGAAGATGTGATGATGPTGPGGTGSGGGVTFTAHTKVVAYQNGNCTRDFDPGDPDPIDGYPPEYSVSCEYPAQTLVAECAPGEQATGGSARPTDPDPNATYNDHPDPETGTPTGWAVDGPRAGGSAYSETGPPPEPPAPTVKIWVVCASSGATGPTGATGATGATGPTGTTGP